MTTWKTETLGALCSIELGKTPSRSNASFWDANRSTQNIWLSIADLLSSENKLVSDSKEYISDKGAALCKLVAQGTLLVSFKLTLGRLAFASRSLYTNEAIAALTIHNENELNKQFLFYYLHFFDWIKVAENDVKLKGMTLNKAKLKEIKVHFPPLPEQRRIVAVLDEAFEGLAIATTNTEKNLKNAREVFESYLNSVFAQKGEGGTEKPIGDFCDLLNGFAFKSEDAVQSSRTQLVRMGNLYGNRFDLKRTTVFYPDEFAQLHRKFLLTEGDLIISLTGTTGKEDYGYVVKVPKCDLNLLMNQRIAKFVLIRKDHISTEYLYYFLRSSSFLAKLYATANGTRQANLSSVTIKTLNVPICSIEKQKLIVASLAEFADYLTSLEENYAQKLAAIAELKQSLLQKAFAGELTKDFRPELEAALA